MDKNTDSVTEAAMLIVRGTQTLTEELVRNNDMSGLMLLARVLRGFVLTTREQPGKRWGVDENGKELPWDIDINLN